MLVRPAGAGTRRERAAELKVASALMLRLFDETEDDRYRKCWDILEGHV